MTRKHPGTGRRVALLGSLAALGGCGFHPVYGTRGGRPGPARRELGAIEVTLIPDRAGQLLRQALQQRLTMPDGAPAKRYSLDVSYGVAGDSIGVQQDSTETRLRLSATASWSLKRLDPARGLVTNGIARALDGVNIINQQYFAADLEGEAAQRRIADAVADQITIQLATYFAKSAPA